MESTADMRSKRKRSFLGVTTHIIDKDSMVRKSWAIGCERFSGTHSVFLKSKKKYISQRGISKELKRNCRFFSRNLELEFRSFPEKEFGIELSLFWTKGIGFELIPFFKGIDTRLAYSIFSYNLIGANPSWKKISPHQ